MTCLSSCKRDHSEDTASKFIRAIRTAPDPAIVLADDCQLNDMARFCTSSTSEFCIFTIDPTFSLGEFDVTPITYRHMLLETKSNGSHPIFLGPLLIHYQKTFAVYLHLLDFPVSFRALERLAQMDFPMPLDMNFLSHSI